MRVSKSLFGISTLAAVLIWLIRYFRPRHSTLVLNEKVVVITGASSGIGRALAFAFARRAARVVLVGRRQEALEAVRREIEPYTSEVMVVQADIADPGQLIDIVEQAIQRFGRIDVLVNNAGVCIGGELVDQSLEHIEEVLRVNLLATIQLTRLVLPHMLAHSHGYILNIGSGAGRTALPLFVPYVATKYGLSGFSDALRRELYRTGVHVALVLPGWTHTSMINSEVEELVERYGFAVEHPDFVAERAVLGLVRGEHEIVLGGLLARLGILAERYAPLIVQLYWRLWLTPEWRAVMAKVGRTQAG